jgi:hypothetical protein
MQIEISDEELHALIDFQKAMAEGAHESCELEEWVRRKNRIAELRKLLKIAA